MLTGYQHQLGLSKPFKSKLALRFLCYNWPWEFENVSAVAEYYFNSGTPAVLDIPSIFHITLVGTTCL